MINPIERRPPHRLGHLDSMRGLAAIGVAVFHLSAYFLKPISESNLIWEWQLAYFDLGKFGVVLFFLISGFVIPSSLKENSWNPLGKFAISRIFRLYPAYWASMMAFLLFVGFGGLSNTAIFLNITMLQSFLGARNLIDLYWTLQIEIIFYVLSAGIFKIGKLNNILWLRWLCVLFGVLALILSLARYQTGLKLPVALPLSLSVMYIGSCVRYWFDRRDQQARPLWIMTLFLANLVPVSLLSYNQNMGYSETWTRYVVSYSTAILAFFLWIERPMMTSKITEYLGRISYSVYLFHAVCMEFLGRTTHFGNLTKFVLACLLTLVVSDLIYRWVEKPFQALGRRISASLS